MYKQRYDVFYCIIDADNMWLDEKILSLSLYVINSLGLWRPSWMINCIAWTWLHEIWWNNISAIWIDDEYMTSDFMAAILNFAW